MCSGIRVHLGEEEEEKRSRSLLSRIENQIINPVGAKAVSFSLVFQVKIYSDSKYGNSWTSVQISFSSNYTEKGARCVFCWWKQETVVSYFSLKVLLCGCRALILWLVFPFALPLLSQAQQCSSIPTSDLLVSWGLVLLARKQHYQIMHFSNFMSR